MPRWQAYNMKMTMYGRLELSCGKFDLIAGNAPSADYFYPGASAPAVSKGQWDYDGEFGTEWSFFGGPDVPVETEYMRVTFLKKLTKMNMR